MGSSTQTDRSSTILIVEDQTPLRQLLVEFLEPSGYRVLTAASGEEAMMRAEEHPEPITILLTDVVLPKMNGRELAEQLTGRQPGLKVLYMSGYPGGHITNRELPEAGTSSFLQKPFTRKKLLAKLDEILQEPPGSQPRF